MAQNVRMFLGIEGFATSRFVRMETLEGNVFNRWPRKVKLRGRFSDEINEQTNHARSFLRAPLRLWHEL